MRILALFLLLLRPAAPGDQEYVVRATLKYEDKNHEWRPVPRGAIVKVSQIYKLPVEAGVSKWVEQYIGYSEIEDDRGGVVVLLRTVGSPDRIRFVVTTQCREEQASTDGKTQRFATFAAVCGSTVPRPLLLISQELRVSGEMLANGVVGEVKIPFHSNYQNLKGIAIPWEGELSTGGYIDTTTSGLSSEGGLLNAIDIPGNVAKTYLHHFDAMESSLGTIRQNHGGALSILADLAQGYDFSRRCRALTEITTPFHQPLEIKGVAAAWSPYGDVPSSIGRSDTVFAEVNHHPRIVVRGGNQNPDEEDPHVVLRAYGSFFRVTYIDPKDPPKGYPDLTKPAASVAEAWERGWDHFLPCAVLRDPRFVDRDFAGKPIPDRSYSFEKKLDEMLETYRKTPNQIGTFHAHRGLQSGFAWAALFWRLFHKYDMDFVNHLLTHARKTSDSPYIDVAALAGLYPEEFETFEALGMVPRLTAEASQKTGPKLAWSVDGMNRDTSALSYDVEIWSDAPIEANRLETFEDLRETILEFDKVGDLQQPNEKKKLKTRFAPQHDYYWRVTAKVKPKQEFLSRIGVFRFEPDPSSQPTPGATTPVGRGAGAPSVTVPQGSPSVSVQPVRLPQNPGSKRPRRHRVRAPFANGTAVAIDCRETRSFVQPIRIVFPYEDSKLSPAELGVYRFDGERWEYVGGTVDAERRDVAFDVSRTGVYALMLDREPPRITSVADGPDPARTTESVTLRFTLDEPARVTLTIVTDRVVRTLCSDEALPYGESVFVWDGPAAEGTYWWTLVAVDRAGHETRTTAGRILRSDAPRGVLTGRVQSPRVRVEILDTTLRGDSFRVEGTIAGTYDVRVTAPNLLPKTLRGVRIPESGSLDLGEVELTDRAMKIVETPSDRAPWTLRYELAIPCSVQLEIVPESGEPFLTEPLAQVEGHNWISWDGASQPNGFNTVRVWALVGEDRILQSEHRVLVDHGLLERASAYPLLFSPNDDGFDDATSLEAVVTHAGTIDAEVFDSKGRRLRTLVAARPIEPGRLALPWDGKDDRGEVLTDGTYSVRLLASYPGPIPSRPVEFKVMLDRIPPKLGEISPVVETVLKSGLPKLRARLLSDPQDVAVSTIRVKVDEVTTAPDSFDPKSGWIEFTPKTSLGTKNDGVHVAIFYAQDEAGNFADPAATAFRVKLDVEDRTAPKIEILSPKEGEKVYGQSYSIVARLTDGESGINSDSIVLSVNGRKVASKVRFIIPGKSGKPWDLWQYEKNLILYNPLTGEMRYNAPLPGPGEPPVEGRLEFTLDVEDQAGRMARSVVGKFELLPDPYPPKIVSLTPASGTTVDRTRPTVEVVFEEQGESGLDWNTLRFFVDGKRIEVAPGVARFQWTPPEPLADRSDHVLLVDIRDRAGNRSATSTSVFAVAADTEPPIIEAITPHPNERRTAGPIPVEAVVRDAAHIELEVDGTALPFRCEGERITAEMKNLSKGRHLLTIRASDASGNASPRCEIPFSIVADLEPPVVALESPVDGIAAFHIADSGGVDWPNVELRLDGKLLPIRSDEPRVKLPALSPGDHVLVLRARDVAGNEAEPAILVFTQR